MAGGHKDVAFRSLRALLGSGPTGGLTDGQLLDRYLDGRDAEAAFAALLERHGPMVLDVCRGALGDHHDAQDAFQATFLVLARRARSIRRREAVAGWLLAVARRVSARARVDAARRRARERAAAGTAVVQEGAPAFAADDRDAVHEEIGRLPEAYRDPLVLCDLEGLTYEAAARRIGCPLGTLSVRLKRARERLRTRLARRGLGASSVLAEGRALPDVPAALFHSTAGSATAGTAPAAVARLTGEVLMALFVGRVLTASAVVLVAGVVAVAAGAAVAQIPAKVPATKPAADAPKPKRGAVVLKYGEGKAGGKKSLGGSGEMIEFTLPAGTAEAFVNALRVHGARYGNDEPPDEKFLVYFLSRDRSEVLAVRMVPYSAFRKGPERWVTLDFDRPVQVPAGFWVVLDFRAQPTKGVFVSYDAGTGKHSRTGLPGLADKPFPAGDWMVEAVVTPDTNPIGRTESRR